jgi:hypothetical protein
MLTGKILERLFSQKGVKVAVLTLCSFSSTIFFFGTESHYVTQAGLELFLFFSFFFFLIEPAFELKASSLQKQVLHGLSHTSIPGLEFLIFLPQPPEQLVLQI